MRRIHVILAIIVICIILVLVIITTSSDINTQRRISLIILETIGGVAAISEIMGLLDRIGVPQSVNEKSVYYIAEQKKPLQTNVIILGPTYSGKTCLISAFTKFIREKYSGKSLPLKYVIDDIDKDFFHLPHNIENATLMQENIYFKFERKQKTPYNINQKISSFKHILCIMDFQGSYSVHLSKIKSNENIHDLGILSLVTQADIVIITLDSSFMGRHQPCQNTKYCFGDDISSEKSGYTSYISELIRVIESTAPNRTRFYAFCLTKADVIPNSVYCPPNLLIDRIFGKKMTDTISKLKPGTYEVFTTSSFGFLKDPVTGITNYSNPNYQRFDPINNGLFDPDNWEPFGVEYPFFRAFEFIETNLLKKRLENNIFKSFLLKKYIPYPKPYFLKQ